MGMIIYTLRPARFPDCTNGGLSATHDRFVVVNVEGPFEPSEDMPALFLRDHPGGPQYHKHLVPAVQDKDGTWVPEPGWWMAGGNYGDTSDSRWSRAMAPPGLVCGHPAAIHDRKES